MGNQETAELPRFTRDRIYCWLTLCWFSERYAPTLWFRLHHNRLYWWLSQPKGR